VNICRNTVTLIGLVINAAIPSSSMHSFRISSVTLAVTATTTGRLRLVLNNRSQKGESEKVGKWESGKARKRESGKARKRESEKARKRESEKARKRESEKARKGGKEMKKEGDK
jgi:hypothetical protein